MPDIVLYGATGYTGKLTAAALHERGADFAIAGRNEAKLEALAAACGNPQVLVVGSGDVAALAGALDGARCLITCVGPFVELGETAAEAALRAGVHYVDSTGEGPFVDRLIEVYGPRARDAGLAMAPAMGFDEVPGDVASTLACDGFADCELTVSYALPRAASTGTLVSALGMLSAPGPRIEKGQKVETRAGQRSRWAPMPPPLGPRRTMSFPLALARLAPLHLDLQAFDTFVSAAAPEAAALRYGFPLTGVLNSGPVKRLIEKLTSNRPEGPGPEARAASKWTILAEAASDKTWRNVSITGTDPYGLTAQTLSLAGVTMAADGYQGGGVVSPVQAVGIDALMDTLEKWGATIETYAPV